MCQRTGPSTKVYTTSINLTVWKVVKPAWKNFPAKPSEMIKNACLPACFDSYVYRQGRTANGRYQGRAFNDRIYRLKRDRGVFDIRLEGDGFHSYASIDSARNFQLCVARSQIGKFVIPKGAKCIHGTDVAGRPTIVSSRIRFEGFVKP